MDHRDLEHFVALAESLHFGRTASSRRMSTSALTRSIQRLEDELGHALFHRDRRSVHLTAAGQRFRRFAQAQLAELELLRQELAADHASPRGELRIACTVTACFSVLPRLLARCRHRYPDIVLELVTQDAARSLQQLETGEVDAAVVPIEDEETSAHRVALTRTELAFIAPAAKGVFGGVLELDPLPWARLPLVAPQRGLDRDRLDRWLAEHHARPPIYAEVGGNEAILAMVAMGVGVALVPELVLDASPMKRKVRRLREQPPAGYTVALCTTPRALRRRVVEVFLELAATA